VLKILSPSDNQATGAHLRWTWNRIRTAPAAPWGRRQRGKLCLRPPSRGRTRSRRRASIPLTR